MRSGDRVSGWTNVGRRVRFAIATVQPRAVGRMACVAMRTAYGPSGAASCLSHDVGSREEGVVLLFVRKGRNGARYCVDADSFGAASCRSHDVGSREEGVVLLFGRMGNRTARETVLKPNLRHSAVPAFVVLRVRVP
jgi:hypothetical protein